MPPGSVKVRDSNSSTANIRATEVQRPAAGWIENSGKAIPAPNAMQAAATSNAAMIDRLVTV